MQTPTHTQKVERIRKVGCSRIFLFKWFFSFQKKIFYLQSLWAELHCLTDLKHFILSHVTLYIAFLCYGALSHGSCTFRALFLKRAVSPTMDTTILWRSSMVLSRRHALELQRGYPTSKAPAPGTGPVPSSRDTPPSAQKHRLLQGDLKYCFQPVQYQTLQHDNVVS